MAQKPDGGPAFPIETTATPYAPGMSLRDYVAASCLAAAFGAANDALHIMDGESERDAMMRLWRGVADAAFIAADAMIAARDHKDSTDDHANEPKPTFGWT